MATSNSFLATCGAFLVATASRGRLPTCDRVAHSVDVKAIYAPPHDEQLRSSAVVVTLHGVGKARNLTGYRLHLLLAANGKGPAGRARS